MNFAIALRRHQQVILALLIREEQFRRKHPVDAILHMLEPIFLITLMSFFWWFTGRNHRAPVGDSVVLFYATGFFPMYLFIYISRRMRRNIDRPRDRFPIEQRLDHVFIHILLRLVDYAVLSIVVFGSIYLFITEAGMPHDLGPPLVACLAIAMLGFGWGVVIMLVTPRLHWVFRRLFPRVSRALIIFSGVFYIPDFMSPGLREILSYNPLLHAINLFRQGFYYNYPSLLLDTTYLAYCTIVFVFFGFLLERVGRRSEGT